MLPQIKHYPVNWVDGMKISSKNFKEMESAVADHIRDANALFINTYNFGILPSGTSNLSSFDVQISTDQYQGITVKLMNCRAITANGSRIEISNANIQHHTTYTQLVNEFSLNAAEDQIFYVVISANPFERMPIGEPSSEEMPPRHPFTMPEYQISVIPSKEVNTGAFGSFHLPIGKITSLNGELKTLTDYIPACASVHSTPMLTKWYNHVDTLLSNIETNSYKVINKIKTRPDKRSLLSELIDVMVQRMAGAFSNTLTSYRLVAHQQPPIMMIEISARIAKNLRSVLDAYTSKEREETLRYFEQWSEILPATVINQLEAVINLKYDHLEVGDTLGKINDLWQTIHKIFQQLSELEYIGKTKEGWKTFINENPVRAEEAPTEKPQVVVRWSPI